VNLATVIMAHPARTTSVERLVDMLDTTPTVVYDTTNHIWATAKTALSSAHPDTTHLLVIQDDTITSQHLTETVTEIIAAHPTTPINLYLGTGRPNPVIYRRWVAAAEDTRPTLIRGPGPTWGVACVYPTTHIRALVEYGDRYTNVGQSYDGRATAYYRSTKTEWLFTWPSLVDHDTTIPSLHSSTPDRHAFRFVGADSTGLGSDWTKVMGTDRESLHPPVMFVHTTTGRKRKVGKFDREWERLSRQGSWEIVG